LRSYTEQIETYQVRKNTSREKEAEGGVNPPLSRNCDGNEIRMNHCPAERDGKAGE